MEDKQGQKPSGGRQVLWTSQGVYEWIDEKVDWLMAPPFLPEETREHLYNARRETMLAARSLIDKSLERLEKSKRRHQGQQATKIPVD